VPSSEFQQFVLDLLAPFDGIELRRMFGGAGLFAGNAMFGIIMNDLLYFKVDGSTRQAYLAEGAKPFAYSTRQGERRLASFFEVPAVLLEEPENFRSWAMQAMAIARRSAGPRRGTKLPRRLRPRRPMAARARGTAAKVG
jgi:DNA transformation protein